MFRLIYRNSIDYSKDYPKIKEYNTWYKTFAFPMTIIPYLARVIVTFNLLGSLRNPIPGP